MEEDKSLEPLTKTINHNQLELLNTAVKIRPEYNISKFANFIFISPYSKQVSEIRKLEFDKKIEGEEVKGSLLIRPAKGLKSITTTEQKVLYALFQIWELRGKPENGEIIFSGREMAKILNKQWCGAFSKRLKESLDILVSTTMTWKYIYELDNKLENLTDQYHILSRATYYTSDVRLKKQKFDILNKVVFNPAIIQNLIDGKTKPFLFREMLSIKDDTSIALYTTLDVYLSNPTSRQRDISSAKLFKNILFLTSERYNLKKIRKQKLQILINYIQGKKISTGATLSLSIRESVDKSDWVLVARAIYPIIKAKRSVNKRRVYMKPINNDDLTNLLIEDIRRDTKITGEDEPLSMIARYYDQKLIYHALSVFKGDYRNSANKPIALFQGILHGLAHKAGKEWVFGCKDGDRCKHRPENSPQQQFKV